MREQRTPPPLTTPEPRPPAARGDRVEALQAFVDKKYKPGVATYDFRQPKE